MTLTPKLRRAWPLALLLTLGGCAHLDTLHKIDVGSTEIKDKPDVSVSTAEKKEAEAAAKSRRAFVEQLDRLADAGDMKEAVELAQQHPKLCLEVLREGPSTTSKGISTAAHAYDRMFAESVGDTDFSAMLAALQKDPARFETYFAKRREFNGYVENREFAKAIKLKLPKLAESIGYGLEIDAWQLQGNAYLLAENFPEAAAAFRKGVELAGDKRPYEQAILLVSLSETERRCDNAAGAVENWQKGAVVAAQLTERTGAFDPDLWEQTSYLHPMEVPWPKAVTNAIRKQANKTEPAVSDSILSLMAEISDDPSGEILFWTAIGEARSHRDELQQSLAAFKNAESMSKDDTVKAWLRIAQARVLIRMARKETATSILAALATEEDELYSKPALAALGVLKLTAGASQQGFLLLQRALDDDESWPGRARAEADLALAYLATGQVDDGLRRLHDAQRRFELAEENDLLKQSMQNEADFLDLVGKKKEARQVRKRLNALSAN